MLQDNEHQSISEGERVHVANNHKTQDKYEHRPAQLACMYIQTSLSLIHVLTSNDIFVFSKSSKRYKRSSKFPHINTEIE